MRTDNLRPCPECGHAISKVAAQCPHCGYNAKTRARNIGCSLVLLVVFGMAALLYWLSGLA